jgi:DNA-binding MurR/RpiR family transcriptional regulator
MGAQTRGTRDMAKSILHTIESNQSGFSKGQKRIAAYILQNYDKAAFMTASKLGTLVGVSESTVVRFATELGYDGYPSMQRALQEMIRSRLTSTQRIQAADDRLSGQDLLSAVMHSDMDKLRMVVDEADRREFNRVVDLIMQARHIYILGVRSSYFVAGYLNFYMHLLFDNATLVQSNAAGEIFEQLFRIGPGDVMIAISFPRYSQVTVNTVKFAKDRGATIVAITDSEVSPLRQAASAALLAPSEMISFVDSMVAPLSMINALLVALGYRLGKDISATFAELESIWNEYGIFGKTDDE